MKGKGCSMNSVCHLDLQRELLFSPHFPLTMVCKVSLLSYFKEISLSRIHRYWLILSQMNNKAGQNIRKKKTSKWREFKYITFVIPLISFLLASHSKCPLGLTPMETSRNRVISSQDSNVCTVAAVGRSSIPTTASIFYPKFLLITQTQAGHAWTALQVPFSPGLTSSMFYKCICSLQTFGCTISLGPRKNSRL